MAMAPLSRIVILTEDGSTIRPKEMVAIPPRNVVGPVISYGLSADGPPSTGTPTPVQDFALEAAEASPSEGGAAGPVQDFAIEAAGTPATEGSAVVQNFAIEAASAQPQEA